MCNDYGVLAFALKFTKLKQRLSGTSWAALRSTRATHILLHSTFYILEDVHIQVAAKPEPQLL